MDIGNPWEYCEAVPEGLREALHEFQNPSRMVVSLNPIPCAIAGISAEEWAEKIDEIASTVVA